MAMRRGQKKIVGTSVQSIRGALRKEKLGSRLGRSHCVGVSNGKWCGITRPGPTIAPERLGPPVCSEDEGDCTNDSDCIGELVCGQANCINIHGEDGRFDQFDNCCMSPGK